MASSWEDGASILRRPVDAGARKRPAPGASSDFMGLGDDGEPPAGGAPEEPAPEAKPRKKRNIFSEQHLLSDRGFRAVYNSFPGHFNTAIPEGQEALALRDLMTCYKEWAFELFPALRFEDFVDRTEAIAKKAAVGELLQELRSKEAKRGEPEPDFAEIVNSTASTRDSSSASYAPRDSSSSSQALPRDAPRSDSFDDALTAEQDMEALLEYEAMLASTRDDARKVPAQEPSNDKSSDEEEFQAPSLKAAPRSAEPSDNVTEAESPPLSTVAEKPDDTADEPRDATDEPADEVDDAPADEVDDDPAVDAEEAPSQAAVEPASQMEEPASQAIDEDYELPSDEEAGDVMEYEARTSILRDMVETTETRRPRTSKALDEAATLLEEESDSDAELDFPATRFGTASQVPPTQGDDDDETQVI
ncbi:hypothetical protein SDRG_13208 [Saprolegnia diclina VS20]|uniref:Chromosome segregation in meiosis protein 3 domain-containing protein n=1 Tax=Saprolegnia diclina (strain VS20) TaxID=1156394 RepID=T0RA82_SAPDV|nr:hypothetical protein SDRG_13208 [Saprolegnia diclina VS20]EQC29053.1 hypothetical protein SDRG_13208 [Saprolegnia diclina VS20]|eukprot:XP_008617512.1 hypothetical protein SDRG_13208 [Saprolegnia diclina VS20]